MGVTPDDPRGLARAFWVAFILAVGVAVVLIVRRLLAPAPR
jgi:hypothetical protein